MKKILFILSIIYFTSCSEKEKPKSLHSSPDYLEQSEVYNSAVERDSTDTNYLYSYWYVYYDVHIAATDARYNGYDILRINGRDFDIEQIHSLLVVNRNTERDYIGVQFFHEVSERSYNIQRTLEP